MISVSRTCHLAATVLLGAACAASAAWADPSPATPAAATPAANGATTAGTDGNSLAEIVVTAEKRSESLQRVPAAVSVVSGDFLQSTGVNNAESLQEVVPSLTFKRGSTNSNSTLSIRGIGTQSFASGAEPSVATVVDGVVMGRAGMATTEFTDVQRVEVLQGPQGTLFGKNASAGVVNMVTRGPTKEFQGDASAGVFQGQEYHANVDLSGPINQSVGYALAAVYSDYPGNSRNFYNDQMVNGFRREGLRGKLAFDLTDSLKLTLAGDWVRANDLCCADVLGTVIPNAQWTQIFARQLAPVVPGPQNFNISNDYAPRQIDVNTGLSAQLDWSFGGYTLTSISAFRRWYNFQQRDGDFHDTAANYVAGLDIALHDQGGLTFKQYSEELRIASPTDQFIDYVGGLFIWHTDEVDYFTRRDFSCTASTLPADATGFQPCAAGQSTFLTTAGTANFDTRFDSQALFGQATAHLTDRLRLIGGARVSHDYVAYTFDRTNDPTTGPGIAKPYQGEGSTSNNGYSGKAGVQYDFSRDVIGYATYSRGYKGPAFNTFFNMSALNAQPIAPETSNAYEIGLKSTLLDRRLTLNAALYRQDFNNFQTNSFVVVNGAVTTSLTNAGTVRSEGFTADFDWRPTDDFTVTGGYAYDKAYIVSYLCAGQTGAALASCRGVHDGAPLPFAPRNKFNVQPSWRLPIEGASFTTHANLSYEYNGPTNFDIDQNPLAREGGYGLLGASLVFTSLDEKYSLSLIGRNLANKFYVDFITPTGNGIAPLSYQRLQIPRDAQRYFGAQVGVKF